MKKLEALDNGCRKSMWKSLKPRGRENEKKCGKRKELEKMEEREKKKN